MNNGYIYLIREREFVRLNENVYKLGKTEQTPNGRLSGYPKNSEVILFIQTPDCTEIEKLLIKIFKNNFKQCLQYGTEYFEGNKDEMKNIINQNIHKIENSTNKIMENITNQQLVKEYINSKYKKNKSNTDINIGIKKDGKYICIECNYTTTDGGSWYKHIKTKKHRRLTENVTYRSELLLQNEIKFLKEKNKMLENQINDKNKQLEEIKKELDESKIR